MNLADPRAWLEAHINLERGIGAGPDTRVRAPSLTRFRALIDLLGSPQLDFDSIHVTGTNGKTSTARILTTLLATAGFRVGAYTSPNLERINERMSVNGEPIDDAALDEQLEIIALVESTLDEPPSYFDILTGAAFRWFGDEAVDVGVIEVGMGGTWDSTNVVDGQVAVITNVDLDHTNLLGNTREAIATDKSGIIKPESIAVIGETDPDLLPIFAARPSADLWLRNRDFRVENNRLAVGGRVMDLVTPSRRYDDVFLSLHGAHQGENAGVALAAAEAYTGEPLAEEDVRAALGVATSPGRLEVVRREPLVILDGAHNVAGAQALRASLDEAFGDQPRTLVVGLLREKDPRDMLTALGLADAARLIVCEPPSPRALDPEVVARAAEALGYASENIEVSETVRDAVGLAMVGTPDDAQVVITGSLYVVGAARGILVSSRARVRFLIERGVCVACDAMSDTRTLVLCKPDAVERRLVGEIVRRIEAKGLSLAALELRHLDAATATRHYAEHDGKPFFADLVSFITRSPLVAMVVEGPEAWKVVRTLMGTTNPREAAPGTIRGDLAIELTENLVHGSDGPDSAAREIALFFPNL